MVSNVVMFEPLSSVEKVAVPVAAGVHDHQTLLSTLNGPGSPGSLSGADIEVEVVERPGRGGRISGAAKSLLFTFPRRRIQYVDPFPGDSVACHVDTGGVEVCRGSSIGLRNTVTVHALSQQGERASHVRCGHRRSVLRALVVTRRGRSGNADSRGPPAKTRVRVGEGSGNIGVIGGTDGECVRQAGRERHLSVAAIVTSSHNYRYACCLELAEQGVRSRIDCVARWVASIEQPSPDAEIDRYDIGVAGVLEVEHML